ncbi:SDR family NAD(P)-dependent oxidoreductase [Kribbella sp.]|uniref:SDR family NAD(P)-dependent oxidoreductase n=1 Tax=Kribbella sp. TaxID=1871183 RepID=UPI002D267BC3|nr:SDR family NAD(P)-dependent oxidoreductase [Kribbella sp.]HZX01451.1 SDR family NAD(P)-dependent oxidoreductase [Kribbella sp.]
MNNLPQRYGEYAVVTGASSGIGEQFAHQLAASGLHLVLVARGKDRLDALGKELTSRYRIRTESVAVDLFADGAVDELLRRTEHLDVGMVIPNAGNFVAGAFLHNDLAAELDVLKLNTSVPMQLAHEYGRRFADRGRGAIILVSSTVGAAPAPYLANYGAAKAYILSLGQALNLEYRKLGVDLLVVTPGPTATPAVANADGIDFRRLPVPMSAPEKVARVALRNLGRRGHVVVGTPNKFMDLMGKFLMPRPVSTKVYGWLIFRALDEDNRVLTRPVRGA